MSSAFVPARGTTTTTQTSFGSAIPNLSTSATGYAGYIPEKTGIKGHHTIMHPIIVQPAPPPATQIIQPVINTPPPPPQQHEQPVVVQQPPINISIDNPNSQSPQPQQQAAAQAPAQAPAATTIINNKI